MTAPTEPAIAPPVAKLTSPGDVVVMIPYVLGFQPADSLVVVSLEGPRKRFGPVVRLDLLDGSAGQVAQQVDYLLAFIDTHRFREVIVVAYSEDARRAGRVVRPLLRRLKSAGVHVAEALRADGGRWFSYACHKACCPAAGVPYDPASAKSAAEAVAHGLTKAESREALRSWFDPGPPELTAAVQAAVPELAGQFEANATDRAALGTMLALAEDDQVRGLATMLVIAQDDMWGAHVITHMRREHAEDQLELWTEVVRVTTDEQLAGPGSLAAFFAWLSGNGVLASHAVDRVLEVAPGHPLATLVRDLLDHTVPPTIWDAIDRGAEHQPADPSHPTHLN
jgi:hypothetical protein